MSQYKNTLHLPKTDFPMKAGLAAREPAMLEKWEQEKLYERILEARTHAPLYVMHDGPPFANGDVHMGTALNKVLKDLVVKSRTMLGWRVPFIPGWDCHGLPIEFKVVQEQRGLSPLEIRKRSEAFARKFIDIQRGQFRRLGVLGDWMRPYLTLDPVYESHVIRAFGRFVEAGLVYRSRKPVLWSTGAQTALAEAEVEYKPRTDTSVTVKFPLVGKDFEDASILIWTTTPWTLPANLAIAVHPRHTYVLAELPNHGRVVCAEALLENVATKTGVSARVIETFLGSRLEGLEARHPFIDRTSKILAAEFVTLDTGTGAVHIAPGHGADDYALGRQHNLPAFSPVDDRGCLTDECKLPELVGAYVFDANGRIVEILAEHNALVASEQYEHDYPHCWRSKTPVIFRAIEQYFIKIDAIRDKALAAVDATEWLPHWGRNRIRGTVETRPDWCISRQRTWGIPLPIFYTPEGEPILDSAVTAKVADTFQNEGTNSWFEKDDDAWAALVGLPEGTTRRNDTLDVWIDSGVSHEAVLRHHPQLAFPADLYLEATDQHRGWFQSSLMTSVALNGVAPYKTVLTHGFVVDTDKKKISKSAQGTYAKPTDSNYFVTKYGADLVRLWVSSVNFTDDVPFSEEIFTRLGDAYRRIRNTLRILLANGGTKQVESPAVCIHAHAAQLPLIDRWMLSRLQSLVSTCREAYETLEFYRAFRALNDFCAVELSSLYVDVTKDRLYCDRLDSPRRMATVATMRHIFDTLCRLLAPILAFTAEEAWGHYVGETESVHLQDLPTVDETLKDSKTETLVAELLDLRGKIAQHIEVTQKAGTISGTLEASVMLGLQPDTTVSRFAKEHFAEVEELFILSDLSITDTPETTVTIAKTTNAKCERCWRHRTDIGTNTAHPTLCSRCAEAVC